MNNFETWIILNSVNIHNLKTADSVAASLFMRKLVSMIRKYHNYTLQTNPMRHEEEPQQTNSHKKLVRQVKQSIQFPLSPQDDCKTGKDAK